MKRIELEFCTQSTFKKLEILESGENWVHFKAYLGHGILDERSTFEEVDGKWLYLNGELKLAQVGDCFDLKAPIGFSEHFSEIRSFYKTHIVLIAKGLQKISVSEE